MVCCFPFFICFKTVIAREKDTGLRFVSFGLSFRVFLSCLRGPIGALTQALPHLWDFAHIFSVARLVPLRRRPNGVFAQAQPLWGLPLLFPHCQFLVCSEFLARLGSHLRSLT